MSGGLLTPERLAEIRAEWLRPDIKEVWGSPGVAARDTADLLAHIAARDAQVAQVLAGLAKDFRPKARLAPRSPCAAFLNRPFTPPLKP